MMSKAKAPVHSCKKTHTYTTKPSNQITKTFFTTSGASYDDSDNNSRSFFPNNYFQSLENVFNKEERERNILKNLIGNPEYRYLNKYLKNKVEYHDQQMGAVHPRLSDIDVQCIKICTIILIGMKM